jgi:hypothetical protein
MRVWESGETLSYVITNFNQERNSIQVCSQGCQGASPGTHFDASGSFRLKDVTVTDGTPTDYTPLSNFWGVNKGTNTYCPSQDFLGRPRTDGQCDIGAIEYGSAPPDTTPPAAVTNFTANGVDRQVALSWTHSASSDNKGTIVRFSTASFPTSATAGTLACDVLGSAGSAGTCTHAGLTNGTTYYYSAFSYDVAGNTGTAVNASAVPQAPANAPPADVENLHRTDTR